MEGNCLLSSPHHHHHHWKIKRFVGISWKEHSTKTPQDLPQYAPAPKPNTWLLKMCKSFPPKLPSSSPSPLGNRTRFVGIIWKEYSTQTPPRPTPVRPHTLGFLKSATVTALIIITALEVQPAISWLEYIAFERACAHRAPKKSGGHPQDTPLVPQTSPQTHLTCTPP